MFGLCCGQKTSDSAWLKCVVIKNVSFQLFGICCVKKRQIQHGRIVLWSKKLDSDGWNV
jgi:hypothetical protein